MSYESYYICNLKFASLSNIILLLCLVTLVRMVPDIVMYHLERLILLGLCSARTYIMLDHSLYWYVESPILGTACRYWKEKLLTKELGHELNLEKADLFKAMKAKEGCKNTKYLMIFSYWLIKWQMHLKADKYNSMCLAKPTYSPCTVIWSRIAKPAIM